MVTYHTSMLAPPVSMHPCSSQPAQTLRPSWRYLVLEGHRSSQTGLPCPFPGSHQSFPLRPSRSTFGSSWMYCVLTKVLLSIWLVPWPRGEMSLLSPLTDWESQTASGQWYILQEFPPGNFLTVKVLKNFTYLAFTYLTLGAKCLGGKGKSNSNWTHHTRNLENEWITQGSHKTLVV